jgi:hypothetical protein
MTGRVRRHDAGQCGPRRARDDASRGIVAPEKETPMDTHDDSLAEVAGSLLAIRVVVAALLKAHPEPERLLQEIRAQVDRRRELDHRLAPVVEVAFDERLHEFTSQVYARVSR